MFLKSSALLFAMEAFKKLTEPLSGRVSLYVVLCGCMGCAAVQEERSSEEPSIRPSLVTSPVPCQPSRVSTQLSLGPRTVNLSSSPRKSGVALLGKLRAFQLMELGTK